MTDYTFENNSLYRYIPIAANSEIARKELVITKDEFIMYYKKWIRTKSKAKSEPKDDGNELTNPFGDSRFGG